MTSWLMSNKYSSLSECYTSSSSSRQTFRVYTTTPLVIRTLIFMYQNISKNIMWFRIYKIKNVRCYSKNKKKITVYCIVINDNNKQYN